MYDNSEEVKKDAIRDFPTKVRVRWQSIVRKKDSDAKISLQYWKRIDEWMDGWIVKRTNGQMDKWTNGLTDG